MLYGLYLSASGLKAQETKQAVISNNLANAQTPGFKRDLAVMRSRLNEAKENPAMGAYRDGLMSEEGGGVLVDGTYMDMSQGSVKTTGSANDLALDGRGFFTVSGPNGQRLLTRDGSFLQQNGSLVTKDGAVVLGADGQPIKLKAGVPIKVEEDGTILQDNNAVGKVGIVDVKDSRDLVKVGGNLMTTDKADAITAAPAETVVRQGSLEQSGVDPMAEIVAMMEGQRVFDANAKMISYQDTTLQEINTIGRVA